MNTVALFQDLSAFVEQIESFNRDVYASNVYHHACSVPEASGLLEEFNRRLGDLEYEAQDLFQIQELLETSIIEYTLLPRSSLNFFFDFYL